MLTKKGKYGLKAMLYLTGFLPEKPIHVLDIASNQMIPKKFLNAILLELRNAGFVNSRMGKNGGFSLARPAATISVGDIVRAIDGPLAPIPCASKTRYQRCDDCPDETECSVRLVMVEAQRALSDVLDNCSLVEFRELTGQRSKRPRIVSRA
jgi:Rrf2 family protein